MKLLMQTDDDCKACNGKGTVREYKPRDYNVSKCEVCSGTGKRLEWIEVVCRGNHIYLIEG